MSTTSNPIVLYDGVCGLCNRLVQFILKRDKHERFRFASLQSSFGEEILRRHGADPLDLDTFYVVLDYEHASERLLARSDGVVYALTNLGGIWKMAGVGNALPKAVCNSLYNLVARNRYRVFGKHESCMLPEPKHRAKFLDQQS
ncbi:MAG: thiol-disulfide oxidoreductase DCC family protein [Pyrinomonadaceae bacterium]